MVFIVVIAILAMIVAFVPEGKLFAQNDAGTTVFLPLIYNPSLNMDATAISLIAGRYGVPARDLKVTASAKAEYPYSGAASYDYKIVNTATLAGYGISLSSAGQEVDREALVAADLAAYTAKYGKMDPALHEALATANPGQTIPVIIALVEPKGATAKRLEFGTELPESEFEAYKAEAMRSVESAVNTVMTPFLGHLQALGYQATPMGLVPYAAAKIRANDLQAIADLPEVRSIGLDQQAVNMNNFTGNRTGAYTVQARGFLGRAHLGVIEVGHGIDSGNPYLRYYYSDPSYRCTTTAWHETGVLGIIYSSHPTYKGMAVGAQIWNGGSCGGWGSELANRESAARSWGADAINNSWGATYASATRFLSSTWEGLFDDMVRNTWTAIIFAAGNYGASAAPKTGWLGNPAGAYNIMTVGVEANTTPSTMNEGSSWVNMDTLHDDMEKPEVTAPGTNMISTTTASPWAGWIGWGTSYAAPVVTALHATTAERIGKTVFDWPETQKAVIMASATRNIESGTVWSTRDGHGGVNFVTADDVSRAYYSGYSGRLYSCAAASYETLATVNIPYGKRIRFAMAYDTYSSYASYTSQPSADLDLWVLRPDGTLRGYSQSWDSTSEIVDFISYASGTYTFRVVKHRCNGDPGYLGWAYWQEP